MSGSKVYQALATGVIDAGLTGAAAAYLRKYYEVQDHLLYYHFSVRHFTASRSD